MSYTPTNWVSGYIITTEKLNKIEQGIADNSIKPPLIIEGITQNNQTYIDYSYNELIAIKETGRQILYHGISSENNAEYYIKPLIANITWNSQPYCIAGGYNDFFIYFANNDPDANLIDS